jgi:nicotinamidase-related amidase
MRVPVFHIMHDGSQGSLSDIRSEIGRNADPVAPTDDELIAVKNYPNSFVGTDLDQRLRDPGTKNPILAGFMTHMCVNSTARGAFNLGYQTTIVANAIPTRDLPGLSGRAVKTQSLQESSLAAVADLFAIVVPEVADLKV